MTVLIDTVARPTSDSDRASRFLSELFPRGAIDRVLLVTPPDADRTLFRFATARRGRYTNYPPYGSAVLAAHLRKCDVEVRILNLNHVILEACHAASTEDQFDFDLAWHSVFDKELSEFQPDLVGITCMFTMTHASMKQVCQRTASLGFPIAIGGVHVSNDIDRVLDDVTDANIAIMREGEVALKRLVQVVRGHLPTETLGQVVLNDPENRLYFSKECQPTEDDINVIPAYDLFDIGQYSRLGTIGAFYCFKPKETKFATVLSNRGCRAQCTFCSVRNFNGVGVRQRSISSVVDELALLEEVYGINHVMWLDDDLLKDHGRAVALFNEKIKRGLQMTWDATNGVIAASCTEEVVAAMAASGCIAINIGMESGNAEILKQVKKPGTIKNFLRAAEVLSRFEEIHTSLFLMIGFPGETLSMIQDTIAIAQQMNPDWCRISPLQPLPNTPMYDSMVAQGLIQAVGSGELRFMGGAYGKQTEIEQGLRLASLGFREAFQSIPLDAMPTPDQITDIWFYMNYHLNFRRILEEQRPKKMVQLQQHLVALSDVISPENGFALYFLAYLHNKMNHEVDITLIDRLRRRLDSSPYWADRFMAFGLHWQDLVKDQFPNTPALEPMMMS